MQELISKLQELWILTQQKYDLLCAQERGYTERESKLRTDMAELDIKLRDFNTRQSEVLKVENVVELARQAELNTKKNEADRVQLEREIQQFKTHKQGEESRLHEKQKFLDREYKAVEDKKKNLEQELSNQLSALAAKLRK